MNRVLRKRLARDIKSNLGRYLALILLTAMGIFLVASFIGSAESILQGTQNKKSENHRQNGQFSVFLPLSEEDISQLSEGGNVIEEAFSIDMPTPDGKVLRLFKNREKTDLIEPSEGRLAGEMGEALVERRFAQVNDFGVGDKITAGGVELEIVGIGTVPDYDAPMRNLSDAAIQSEVFGLLFVTSEQYDYIRGKTEQKAQEYTYTYRLGDSVTHEQLKERIKSLRFDFTKVQDKYFKQSVQEMLGSQAAPQGSESLSSMLPSNLTSFIKASDNGRIEAASGDVIMNKIGGLIAGVIVLILFAYVISVFVVHQIDRESSVIGSLYALGVKKRDLLRHYITLPTIITFIGAAIGTALSLTPIGIENQMQKSYEYFSLPDFDIILPAYLIVYALIAPPLISAVVNTIVINKRLSQTALSLIRSEQRAAGYKQFNIKSKSFEKVFRIRQMIRELRCAVTVVLGMFISMLVIVLGLNTHQVCKDVNDRNIADTKYEFMYLYKYPQNQAPSGGEAAYIESFGTDITGYNLQVSVIGLDGESKFFDAQLQKGTDKAVINTSLNERFGYDVGDKVTFFDPASDTDRTFTVTGISDYSPGFTIFMDKDSMCELFGRQQGYYNAVYSDHALDIDEGRLYSVTTKDEIKKSAGVFSDMMRSFVIMLISAGSVIFCVVMYLMMNVMIDRSAFGISLIKIFGYRPKEIRSLYLTGNLIIIAVGGLICIPAAKLVMGLIYPQFLANIACCMDTSYPWYMYVMIYCIMMLVYLLINKLLMLKIDRITPAQVLKNRE